MHLLFVFLTLFALTHRANADVVEAETLLRQGRLSIALASLREHLEETPDDIVAHELLIDILINIGQADMAAQTYGQRVIADPGIADSWYLMGRAMLDPGESARAYNEATRIQPDHARAWMGLGSISRADGNLTGAEQAFGIALSHDTSLTEAWIGLWTVQVQQGAMDTASATIARAVAHTPHSTEAWLAQATMDRAESIPILQRGVTTNPEDVDLNIALARAAFAEMNMDIAAVSYPRATRLAPEDNGLRIEAALVVDIANNKLDWRAAQQLLAVRNNPTEASALDPILARWPRSGWPVLIRGNIHQGAGQIDAAEQDLRAAMKLMPSNGQSHAALGLLLLGTQRPAEALPLLTLASNARPGDVDLAVAVAIATAETADPSTAGMMLLDLQEQFPESSVPAKALAHILLDLGELDRAYTVLQDAIRRAPDVELILALAGTAQQAGRPEDAASVLLALSARTGDPRFAEAAQTLLPTNGE